MLLSAGGFWYKIHEIISGSYIILISPEIGEFSFHGDQTVESLVTVDPLLENESDFVVKG